MFNVKQLKRVAAILKDRFPNLNVVDTIDLSEKLIEAIFMSEEDAAKLEEKQAAERAAQVPSDQDVAVLAK